MLQTYFKKILTSKTIRLQRNVKKSTCQTNIKETHSLENKIVIITGGANGIGYEIANRFLEKGVKLAVLLDINEKRGKEAVWTLNNKYGDCKSTFMKCDVTKDLETLSKKIIGEYKQIDVLVNSAGILNEARPKKVININLVSLIEWSFTFLNHMRKDKDGKGGTIMNISSIYGFRVDPFIPVYQASKFGIMGFTRSLGHPYRFKKTGVRVVSLNPGFTETELTSNFRTSLEVREDFLKCTKKQPWQKVKVVGLAAVEVFERAESGTAWLIEGSNPVAEIKHCIKIEN